MKRHEKNRRIPEGTAPKKMKGKRPRLVPILFLLLLLGFLLLMGISYAAGTVKSAEGEKNTLADENDPDLNDLRPALIVDLLDVNPYSRSGRELSTVNAIVIHYTANPGSTAKQNRDYFNNLQTTHTTSASSHFVVGLEGENIQCIPCNEVAFASNDRNDDSIAIECCIEDSDGKFNKDTYNSAVKLTAWLAVRYNLKSTDVIRHYDVTGKICPKYYVEHEDAWKKFRKDIKKEINRLKKKLK